MPLLVDSVGDDVTLVLSDVGATGPSGTLTVGATTTLSPGTSATVTNSGTSTAAIFNFGIPRGATGTTGAAGPNTVTTSTTTNITGLLKGSGSTVLAATAGTDYLTPSGAATLYAARANNLSDLASVSTARTNLGLGTLATQNGTFSGTSSGTNTGDQDISGLIPRLSTITVTGTTPAFPGPLVESTTLNNGRRQWFGPGNAELRATSTDNWNLSFDDGTNSYLASKISESYEPWKLFGWGGHTGPGSDPIFSIDPPVLLPVNGASGTAAIVTDPEGRVSTSDMIGLGTGVATALAVNVGSAGAFVTFNGALGTPSSGTLTSCTGLPISTGVSGLGTNVATFLATPTSANFAAAVTGETGSGSLVFATSPTLTTPILGTPTSGTLTNCTGYPELSLAGVVRAVATTDLVRAAGVSGADGVLSVPLASGKAYRIRGMVKLVGQLGGVLSSNIGGPNCTFENVLAIRPGFTFNAGASNLTPYTSLSLHNGVGATTQQVMFDGVINTSAAGNFVFAWVSTGASATRAAGSYIEATPLN